MALLAFCALLIGGGVWLRASLAASFSQGEAYGRALAAAQAAVALRQQSAALESVRRGAEQEAAALEIERDQLQEKFDDLEKALASSGGRGAGVRHCLDAGVVHALDAIGGAGANARAP
ncbi:MAG: hypothetical protein Q8M31_13990 [Beijerinckiaceae bacterium]|nr:hypothetical protein [Beijerinckiaceae bacterium]